MPLVHTMAVDRPVFHLCSAAVCGQQNHCCCQQELPSPFPVCCQLPSDTPAELSPSCAPLRCTRTPQTPALSHEGRNELLVAEGTVTCCFFFRGLLLGDRSAPTLGQVSCVCPACASPEPVRRALPSPRGTRASCCSAPVLLKPIPQGEDGAGSAVAIPQCRDGLMQVMKVPSHPDCLLSTRLTVSSQAEADGRICLFLGWREDLNMSFLCITSPGKAQAVL